MDGNILGLVRSWKRTPLLLKLGRWRRGSFSTVPCSPAATEEQVKPKWQGYCGGAYGCCHPACLTEATSSEKLGPSKFGSKSSKYFGAASQLQPLLGFV